MKFRTCNSCTFPALLSPPLHVLFTVQMVSAGGPWTSVCLAVYCRRLLVGQGSTQRGASGVACEIILLSFVLALLAQTSAPSPWVTAFQAVPAKAESGSAKLKYSTGHIKFAFLQRCLITNTSPPATLLMVVP